ncbi:putative UPF0481 protein At3g02645 [Rhodamnia argentea]|uniref:UPF0481 protein At3g02645 n=1 Tax=Rhodamnia argentea TaxID=178133 RepID=A0A8B8PQQ1_9MYRT|nr:putative UPF0481 protein At3g02645 [Rhodamnia argentea]
MREWFNHVQTDFNEELEQDIDSNVCVFQVPKSLSSSKPEAYTPQLIGLGPYHHLQPQLTEMERVKLDVVKKLNKEFHHLSFAELVSKLSKLDLLVRACYHKFLDMDSDMLSWIMTVDSLFLFYQVCQHGVNKSFLDSSPFLEGLADNSGKKLADATMRRDVMMLENQIPIFFVQKMLTVGCASLQVAERKAIVEEIFPRMLVGFCKALSPIKATLKCQAAKALKRTHLLDLLYSMVVSREDEAEIALPADPIKTEEHKIEVHESLELRVTTDVQEVLNPPQNVNYVAKSMVELVENSNLTILRKIKPHVQMLEGLMSLYSKLSSATDSFGEEEAPAEEKALIPTASSLAKAGVKFSKTQFLHEILFDEKTHTFHLPVIKLVINSEVVIRNLVAYEAMAISGPLVFARFMELMDGLINTVDDVKLLKNKGIITGRLKDDEVTHLFNGMSDSIEVNGDCPLDEIIKTVNKFYDAAPTIKTHNMMERYVYGAWKVLVIAATALLFLLMGLQTFCSAYSCSSLVKRTN